VAQVGVASDAEHLHPSFPARSETGIGIAGGRNEFVSFQICVAGPCTVTGVRLPPFGPFAAGNIHLFNEYELNITTATASDGWTGPTSFIMVPIGKDDVLGEDRNGRLPQNVPTGQLHMFWVDLHIPPATTPGTYQGQAFVSLSGVESAVSVTVTVYNYTLSSTSSLRTFIGSYFPDVRQQHSGATVALTHTRLQSRYAQLFLDHRLSLSGPDTGDTSLANYNAFFGPFLDGTAPTQLAGAKWTSFAMTSSHGGPTSLGSLWGGPSAFIANATTKAWLPRFFAYLVDEPAWTGTSGNIAPYNSAWKSINPNIRTLVTCNIADATRWGVQNSIDLLVPVIQQIWPPGSGSLAGSYEAWRTAGVIPREVWEYQSNNVYQAGYLKYVADASALQMRQAQWMNYLLPVTGELFFSGTYSMGSLSGSAWNGIYTFGGNGGTWVFPGCAVSSPNGSPLIGGQNDIPLSSFLLKQIRQGLQEYEYGRMLDAHSDTTMRTLGLQMFPSINVQPSVATFLTQRAAIQQQLHLLEGGTNPGAPVVTGISPNVGDLAGGDTIIVTGSNFGSSVTVSFGTQPGTVSSSTATAITVVTPAHQAGTVNVTVTNVSTGASTTVVNGFSFNTGELPLRRGAPLDPGYPVSSQVNGVSTRTISVGVPSQAPSAAGPRLVYASIIWSTRGNTSAAGTVGGARPAGSVSVLDYGATGNGTTDDTAAFQAATNTGKTVWVPRPSAFYRVTAPVMLKGSIVGDSGDLGNLPLIRMFGSNGDGYHTTLVVRGYHGAAQLVIAGLQIDNQYTSGASGEWDHNVTISDSDNVRVAACRLLNARGDGVQIGEWKRFTFGTYAEMDCKNILVENNYIYNPFRCTVAPLFTSVGSVIRGNYHRKINRSTNGTFIPPIDIEPDAGPQNSVVWNLLIEDNVVDTHTSDGANLYFIWQVTSMSNAPDPVHGTRARNNRGYWYGLSNSTLAEDTNNVLMDPAPDWTMQPLEGAGGSVPVIISDSNGKQFTQIVTGDFGPESPYPFHQGAEVHAAWYDGPIPAATVVTATFGAQQTYDALLTLYARYNPVDGSADVRSCFGITAAAANTASGSLSVELAGTTPGTGAVVAVQTEGTTGITPNANTHDDAHNNSFVSQMSGSLLSVATPGQPTSPNTMDIYGVVIPISPVTPLPYAQTNTLLDAGSSWRADELLPNLWMTGTQADGTPLGSYGFDVFYQTALENTPYDYPDLVVHDVHLNDGEPTQAEWARAQQYADLATEDYLAGKHLLIGCQGGGNRTGLMAGLVLHRLGLPGDKALQFVQQQRPGALPGNNPWFVNAVLYGDPWVSSGPYYQPPTSGMPAGWVVSKQEDCSTLVLGTPSWAADTHPNLGPYSDNGQYHTLKGISAPAAYRASLAFGDGGWLTAEAYSRSQKSFSSLLSVVNDPADASKKVLKLACPEHTDALVIRPTQALPEKYRISLRVGYVAFGNGLAGLNGYSSGSEMATPWWNESAVPQNGCYWLAIYDQPPLPQNNTHAHHHRKVCIDVDSNQPPAWTQVWNGTGFVTSGERPIDFFALNGDGPTSARTGKPFIQYAGGQWRWQNPGDPVYSVDSYLPDEWYDVMIQRDGNVFTMSVTGRFRYGGQRTYSAQLDAKTNHVWHWNRYATDDASADYDTSAFPETGGVGQQWPAGTLYPDYFMFGVPHENYYEGFAYYGNVKLEVWQEGSGSSGALSVGGLGSATNHNVAAAEILTGVPSTGPTIISVTPSVVSTEGGDTVTITGSGFENGVDVFLRAANGGYFEVTSEIFMNSTEVKVIMPVYSAGTVDVYLRNPDGQTASMLRGLTYAAPSGTTPGGPALPPGNVTPVQGKVTLVRPRALYRVQSTTDPTLSRVQDQILATVQPSLSAVSEMPSATAGVFAAEGWSDLRLMNSWASFGGAAPGFYKDSSGRVNLRGVLTGGQVGKPAAVLPRGYRPAYDFTVPTINGASHGAVRIGFDGNVIPSEGVPAEGIALDGITFRAER
jgi:hypothetical protein